KLSKLLSDFEKKVLNYYLEGKSYQEIGEILKRDSKSIDNALQRIKRKIEKMR
ncbi:MAG TPA: RNA polymerase sporulation sigma factor SigH, partial [Candidatus Moranbacteria bacterium]|nr:RNA polymerase sporulation sigma factor SigH [Candidatus Moranbacteria bacterium]